MRSVRDCIHTACASCMDQDRDCSFDNHGRRPSKLRSFPLNRYGATTDLVAAAIRSCATSHCTNEHPISRKSSDQFAAQPKQLGRNRFAACAGERPFYCCAKQQRAIGNSNGGTLAKSGNTDKAKIRSRCLRNSPTHGTNKNHHQTTHGPILCGRQRCKQF